MSSLSITPIQTEHDLYCPSCGAAIYKLFPSESKVIRGGFWLRDGDLIPGLYNALTEDQKKPNGFDYELLVGSQSCCGKDYYVIDCKFINAHFSKEENVVYFFEDSIYEGKEKNFIVSYHGTATIIPAQWVMSKIPSSKGVIHSHLFGPFELTEEIGGVSGVSACCGSFRDSECAKRSAEMLLEIWDDARYLCIQPNL